MSRISELLEKVISKVNDSVKRTPQNFSEQDKKQIRDNIGVVKGDFNQNDIDAADYIRNKPFHTVEVAGWEEIANNITNDSENIIVSKPIDLDNLNLRILTSAGEEDIITKDSKTLIVKIRDDGSYVLQYSSGIMPGSAVYEFRLNGNVDGSGNTIIPYVDMVSTDATLSVYQWSVIDKQYINEDAIPQEIARVSNIPEINYPVTSVNGKTGDVVISEGVKSWNDLQDKPFGEGYKLICANTDAILGYVSEEVFKAGKNYIVIWNGVEYIGKTIDSNGTEHYREDYKDSSLFLYDKNGNYVTGNIWCYYDEEFDAIACVPYFADYDDTVYVYDPTETEITTVDDKFISENIARKTDISWENLQDKPFYDPYTIRVILGSGDNVVEVNKEPDYKEPVKVILEDGYEVEYEWFSDLDSTFPSGTPTRYLFASDGLPELGWFKSENRFEFTMSLGVVNLVQDITIPLRSLDERFIPDSIARSSQLVESWNDLSDKPFYCIPGEEVVLCQDGKFLSKPNIGESVSYINSSTGAEYTGVWQDVSEFDYTKYGTPTMFSGKAFFFVSEDIGCIWYLVGSYCDCNGRPIPYVTLVHKEPDTIQQLDEKFIPDTIARTNDIKEPFYVTMTDNGDGTYTSDKTVEDILSAHNSDYIVKCKINLSALGNMNFILPICAINGGVIYYGGTADVFSVTVEQLPIGEDPIRVNIQQLTTVDDKLITDEEIDTLQSKLDGGVIDE